MRKTRKIQLIMLSVAVVCCGSLPAIAQTPDEEPPALETVCDMETGAAYGMCNAYCEAMDCELANDGDPLTAPSASAAACDKVANRFQQLTGRELPCETSCPCASDLLSFPLWNSFLAADLVPDICRADAWFCELWGVPVEHCTPPAGDRLQARFEGFRFVLASALGYDLNPYFPVVRIPFCGESPGFFLPVSPAQGAVCRSQLEAALDAAGIVCDHGT